MKNACKGFTLVELLISMLVVAIAMLGFAALQAYSSRSLNSTYSKQASSDALNSYVHFIESSMGTLSKLNWGTGDNLTATLTCGDSGNAVADPASMYTIDHATPEEKNAIAAFKGTFATLCKQYVKDRSDIESQDFGVRIIRTKNVGGITGLTVYRAIVAFAYKPVAQGKFRDATTAADKLNVTLENYCPYELDNDDEEEEGEQITPERLQELRIKNNVVCNRVEIGL
ncbi:prepilin-type N-terminal cleavage/methylation domain-containing protein [Succinimonas amylolytica]|uniref:prepilin-type N-terminal cleavage/methylation domain-containing protein n=1 Tax=Succinimonas amylolytica TaxID=83769 RepID=UPI0023A865C5